ncbi:MAG: aminopeptidase P family N-terminal domain-containing protein, partial [Phycisphaerae bacterium]
MAKKPAKSAVPKLYAGRIARVREAMARPKLPAYLLTNPKDCHYLTGFTGEDSAVLITPKRVYLISDSRFDETIDKECHWTVKVMRRGLIEPEIGKLCRKLKLSRVGVQADRMTLACHADLRKSAKPTRLVKAPPIVNDLRLLKDAEELKIIGQAIVIAQDAF